MRNVLKKFGLSDKEIDLYIAGLKSGPASVQDLAKSSGIKRPTVYVIIEHLQKLGLANQSFKGEQKLFEMARPQKLFKFIDEEKRETEEKEKSLGKIISDLEALARKPEFAADIKIYEGFDKIVEIIGEFARNKNLTYAISSAYYFDKIAMEKILMETFMKNSVKIREKYKNRIQIITDPNPFMVRLYLLEYTDVREFRFLPEGVKLPAMMNICDDRVALISARKPYSIVVIKNQTIAVMIKFLFEMTWQSLEGKNLPTPEQIEEARKIKLR